MRALVVADGEVPDRAALDEGWPGWSEGIGIVVAADGGADRALRLGLPPDLVVGDMDSLPAARVDALRSQGTEIVLVPAEKDESDMELALLAAIERGATGIVVLGAFGGERLDHALANVGLLAMPALAGADVALLDARTRVTAIVAPGPDGKAVERTLVGRPGDLVTLLPLGAEAAGVTTEGLRYPLDGEPLHPGPARGLSNVRTAPTARVRVAAGFLVIVETAGILSA